MASDLPSVIQFDLITPENKFFSGTASMITIPGTLGEFGVLPGHAPFISTLKPGVITIDANGEKRRVVVLSGIAEVVPDHCVVLAQTAEDATGLSAGDAQVRLSDARKAVDDAVTEAEQKQAAYGLAVAMALSETA